MDIWELLFLLFILIGLGIILAFVIWIIYKTFLEKKPPDLIELKRAKIVQEAKINMPMFPTKMRRLFLAPDKHRSPVYLGQITGFMNTRLANGLQRDIFSYKRLSDSGLMAIPNILLQFFTQESILVIRTDLRSSLGQDVLIYGSSINSLGWYGYVPNDLDLTKTDIISEMELESAILQSVELMRNMAKLTSEALNINPNHKSNMQKTNNTIVTKDPIQSQQRYVRGSEVEEFEQ